MAEGVFHRLAANSPLAGVLEIDSAGTHDYHVGENPDPRAIDAATRRGYQLDHLLSRQIGPGDLEYFDHVLAMDAANIRHLKAMCPTRLAHKIELLMDYGGESHEHEVPDPFRGSARDFEHALDLIEDACHGLLKYLLDMQRLHAAATTRSPE